MSRRAKGSWWGPARGSKDNGAVGNSGLNKVEDIPDPEVNADLSQEE
jgi:hypothetical protein